MINTVDRHYRTTSLPLAVFLLAKEQKIAGINQTRDYPKKEFEFVRSSSDFDDLVEVYKYGEKEHPLLQVQVHEYENARNTLLDRLNQ